MLWFICYNSAAGAVIDLFANMIYGRSEELHAKFYRYSIDNRHPYLDWKHTYSAHTKLPDYPRFAPEVLKHIFSFKNSTLLSGYSSVDLTSKLSCFLGGDWLTTGIGTFHTKSI